MRLNAPTLAGMMMLALLAAPVSAAPAPPAAKDAGEGSAVAQSGYWPAAEPVGAKAPPVSDKHLEAGTSNPSQWLLYGGNYGNYRHSPSKKLTPKSVKGLKVAWSAPTGTVGQFETSPVVYGGVMYITTSYNRIMALDAQTGQFLWRYDVKLPDDTRTCCGPVNRGVGISGDLVLMATLDARLFAFDRKTGKVAWTATMANYKDGIAATSAPLIVGNLAIIGIAGGEYGARGFIDAYDVKTGKRVWRRYTVPQAGERGVETWAGESWKTGGAPAWTQGAYDVDTKTLFWTTGNPSPDWNGDARLGDNLYSDSLLALEPNTGALKWHFQFTPHDVWDFDGNTQVFLIDTVFEGKKVKAIAQPNRNGYFYLIDRDTGKFLRATQYIEQLNWAKGVDAKGRPIVNPEASPKTEPRTRVCPSNLGGMNGAWTASYDPRLGLAFVPSIEACMLFQKGLATFAKGVPFFGGMPQQIDGEAQKSYGLVSAVDVKTGKVKWRYRDKRPMMSGAVTTAGGVLFTSTMNGEAIALDSTNGKRLWSFRMGGPGRGQPIVYEIGGKVYVAVPSGGFALIDNLAGAGSILPEGGQLFVFSLGK